MKKVTVKDIHGGLNEKEYICSPDFAAKVASSLNTKPVAGAILSGPAGTGKSYLPQILADVLDRELFFHQCSAGTREDDLLMKLLPSEKTVSGISIEPGKIYEATQASKKKKVILVLDEWDKTRPTADGFFLDYLQYGRLSIPGKTIKANLNNLTIFLTTNNEREFQEPLLRRFPKIDVTPLEPQLVTQALINTHKNSPHVQSAVEIYVKTVVSGMPKPATIQELRQFLDASKFLGKGADWNSLVYQFITKTPENHSILAKVSEKLLDKEQIDSALKDINKSMVKVNSDDFGEYTATVKDKSAVKNNGPMMPRGKIISYDDAVMASDDDIDIDDMYGVIESNALNYTKVIKSTQATDNFLEPDNFKVSQDVIGSCGRFDLGRLDELVHLRRLSGEIVLHSKYCTLNDLKLFRWYDRVRFFQYSTKKVIGRINYQWENNRGKYDNYSVDFLWTKEDGIEFIVPLKVLEYFQQDSMTRRKYYRNLPVLSDLGRLQMHEIHAPELKVGSYLNGDYKVINASNANELPIINLKNLVDVEYISTNSFAGDTLKRDGISSDNIPFYNELHDLKGVNVEPVDNHLRIHDDNSTFDMELQIGDRNDTGDVIPICVKYSLFNKPPWELLLMLSSISYSGKIAVFNAVKANANKVAKHLKNDGWHISTNKVATKMFKSGIMYTAWLFDNVVIFNFCIGADTSKYVNPYKNNLEPIAGSDFVSKKQYNTRWNSGIKVIGGLSKLFQDA